jgi:signal transduction histidine kinase/DNA-binding response OmpR family regulator
MPASTAGPNPLAGGGEMGELMRSIDWSKTPVGAVERWPQSLRTALSILLESGFPMYIAWGKEFTQFYNDAYRPILGSTKHPTAMGIGTRETFAEIWDIIGPMFEGVMQGKSVSVTDFLLPLDRHGFAEECYFIFSYSPIREETGDVGGVLVTVTETTERVLGARRMETLHRLAGETMTSASSRAACAAAASVLASNAADLPFVLLYLVGDDGRIELAGHAHVGRSDPAIWHVAEVAQTATSRVVEVPADLVVEQGARPTRALVLPVRTPGAERPSGVLVAGLSGRLRLHDAYESFLQLVAGQVGTAIASAHALEQAKARAEALGEIDRAKTAFFSNVSHEFRTPLTLMLGPVEDALADVSEPLGPRQRDRASLVHRNALRLAKLVNTLLDFARLEAGRIDASYVATDLAVATRELAGVFRSAIERAGLRLDVSDIHELPEPAWVDREMWEKIVLNLLSNALKFTFEGVISVGLRVDADAFELAVSDTGTGIEPEELPRVFERFHRARGSRARTQEGTGIGLALVQELARLHGGSARVESELGKGTTFFVRILRGNTHLPQERLDSDRSLPSTSVGSLPYVQEALRWLPHASLEEREQRVETVLPLPAMVPAARPRERAPKVLVADDNVDMREYLRRMLTDQGCEVQAVSDGAEALAAANVGRPDLVVSDVMMPRLGGFELLHALRASKATRDVPVLLLSARAGEEATLEGLAAGADDYVVKPFSARELVARVEALLARAEARTAENDRRRMMTTFFENAPVGVAVLRGPEHVFEFVNRKYVEILPHKSIDTLVGHSVRDALPELAGQGIYEILDRVYAQGETYRGHEIRLELARGPAGAREEAFVEFVYEPMRAETGRVEGIAVMVYEVTDLVRARRNAEAGSRAKDEFLAMLGHELRNPLAPMVTALELLGLRGAAPRERAILDRQVRHLKRLVDDLLDVSRLTRGKLSIERHVLDVADVLADAVEIAGPLLEQHAHLVHTEVPKGTLFVEGDRARLCQVFANLVTNAAKYTPPGGRIDIAAERDGDTVRVDVRDTGVGISPEFLPRVFDLFEQEQKTIDRAHGGLGLGLAIVKHIVALHGGGASASSEGVGRGSVFSVRLPLAAAAPAEIAAEASQPAPMSQALRVLVVDDSPDAVEVMQEALRFMGFSTRVALDGREALAIAREFRPEVALLDIGLPIMDGYELAGRLRELLGSDVHLVALTGYGQESDRARARDAGFDRHLVKPVDLDVVLELLETYRDARPKAPA